MPAVLGIDGSRLVGLFTGVGRHLQFIIDAWSRQELPLPEVRVYAHAPLPDLLFMSSYSLPPGVRTKCAVLNMGILEGPFVAAGLPTWNEHAAQVLDDLRGVSA